MNDYAGMLSPEVRTRLEQALRAFEVKTSNQLVVATFTSLGNGSIEDFSIRLAEKWRVGQKGKDNGVIFLIFKDDRKMRIEVGYGLEGTLPDALAGQIISQKVAPYFKKGDYDGGILSGVAAIIEAAQGEFKAEPVPMGSYGYDYQRPLTPQEIEELKKQGRVIGQFVFFLVAFLFAVDFLRYRTYAHQHRIYRNRYTFWEWWLRFAILLFLLNIILRMLFYAALFSRGGGYGGRSGGGFSGGGGSFGGGGASGGW